MAHPVSWFQIQGKNGKALQAFYKKVFAWKMSPLPDGGGMVTPAPGEGGIPGGVGPSPSGKPSVAVYVSVDNLRAHLDRVAKAGGRVALRPTDLPQGMGAIAGFFDPAGNWTGLWQPPKPTAKKRVAKKSAAKKRTAKKATAKKRTAKKATQKQRAPKRAARARAAKKPSKKRAPKRRAR